MITHKTVKANVVVFTAAIAIVLCMVGISLLFFPEKPYLGVFYFGTILTICWSDPETHRKR